MEPAFAISGTSAPKFQIAAYRCISTRIAGRGRLPRCYEIPASGYIRGARVSETGLIAMQKVVGSNPISRFERDLALQRDFVVHGGAGGSGTIPSYRLLGAASQRWSSVLLEGFRPQWHPQLDRFHQDSRRPNAAPAHCPPLVALLRAVSEGERRDWKLRGADEA